MTELRLFPRTCLILILSTLGLCSFSAHATAPSIEAPPITTSDTSDPTSTHIPAFSLIPAPIYFDGLSSTPLSGPEREQDITFLGGALSMAHQCTLGRTTKIQQHIATQLAGTLLDSTDMYDFSVLLDKYQKSYLHARSQYAQLDPAQQHIQCTIAATYWRGFESVSSLTHKDPSSKTTNLQPLTMAASIVHGRLTSCSKSSDVKHHKVNIQQLKEQSAMILALSTLSASDLPQSQLAYDYWHKGFALGLNLPESYSSLYDSAMEHKTNPEKTSKTSERPTAAQQLLWLQKADSVEQLSKINVLSCFDAAQTAASIQDVVKRRYTLIEQMRKLSEERKKRTGSFS